MRPRNWRRQGILSSTVLLATIVHHVEKAGPKGLKKTLLNLSELGKTVHSGALNRRFVLRGRDNDESLVLIA